MSHVFPYDHFIDVGYRPIATTNECSGRGGTSQKRGPGGALLSRERCAKLKWGVRGHLALDYVDGLSRRRQGGKTVHNGSLATFLLRT